MSFCLLVSPLRFCLSVRWAISHVIYGKLLKCWLSSPIRWMGVISLFFGRLMDDVDFSPLQLPLYFCHCIYRRSWNMKGQIPSTSVPVAFIAMDALDMLESFLGFPDFFGIFISFLLCFVFIFSFLSFSFSIWAFLFSLFNALVFGKSFSTFFSFLSFYFYFLFFFYGWLFFCEAWLPLGLFLSCLFASSSFFCG